MDLNIGEIGSLKLKIWNIKKNDQNLIVFKIYIIHSTK
jgi:hypothetical protein